MYLRIRYEQKIIFIKVLVDKASYWYINEYPNLNIRDRFNLRIPKMPNLVRIHKTNKSKRDGVEVLEVVEKIPKNTEFWCVYGD